MEVEAVFPAVSRQPLSLRMSTTSPGRYARHEFAKNVYAVRAFDGRGRALTVSRPDAHQWDVTDHDGTVRVVYRVFGDRVDGTYLAIDSTHAHVNMPATLMWARGFEHRPARLRFERPAGKTWSVATQLYPTDDALVFTAPNLAYLMDSPAEFSDLTVRTFTFPDPSDRSRRPTFRYAVHHDGSDADVTGFVENVKRIVRETMAVFGELPDFETNTYTFIADYLPYAGSDAMEHRNSSVLAAPVSIARAGQHGPLWGSVAHEFFHAWNVERIRPKSLEPFNLEEAPVSGELWLAEGFTNYYQALVMQRSGLSDLSETLRNVAFVVNVVAMSPGRQLRSAVEMSQLAPFTDDATATDRTNWDNTFVSYYTWGEAIGLGLDLALRVRSNGVVTLDDYMRALWRTYGKPGGPTPGTVAVPYTLQDARQRLADVSGDPGFANDFFTRYIEGREVVDYRRLLAHAGLVLRKETPGRSWLGDVSLAVGPNGARMTAAAPFGSPLYAAGVERDDVVTAVDGQRLTSGAQLSAILHGRRPGDRIRIAFLRRGERVEADVILQEDPTLELVPAERLGQRLTPAERKFREAWLSSRQ
jgi:predicted metalloprotease with PDZ domain